MKKIKSVFVILIIILMATSLHLSLKTHTDSQKVFSGTVFVPDGNWTVKSEKEKSLIEYTCQISQKKKNGSKLLLLRTFWKKYEVLVDKKVIYKVGSSHEASIHLLNLPEGKKLTIRFLGAKAKDKSLVEKAEICIGNENGFYRKIIKENLYAVIFGVASLILGLISLGIGIYMRTAWSKNIYRALKSLGLYILCTGIWIVTDSRILLLFVQKNSVVEQVSFLTFFLLPLPLLEFTKKMIAGTEKVLNALQTIFLAMLFFYTVNYIWTFVPVSVPLMIEHAFMMCTIFVILYHGLHKLKNYKSDKLSRIMIGYIIFCIFSMISFLFFYKGNTGSYSMTYVAGIVAFIFFLGDAACRAIYEQIKESANAAVYAKLAYLDVMTGLENQTAFLEAKEQDSLFFGAIAYIMIDANNLKQINDTLGHQKGDELIIRIASCIKRAAGESGRCYRVGGDEFVICLKNKNVQEVEIVIKKIQEEVAEENMYKDIELSVAIGYAWSDEEKKDLDTLLKQADAKMYANKQKMKAEKLK